MIFSVPRIVRLLGGPPDTPEHARLAAKTKAADYRAKYAARAYRRARIKVLRRRIATIELGWESLPGLKELLAQLEAQPQRSKNGKTQK